MAFGAQSVIKNAAGETLAVISPCCTRDLPKVDASIFNEKMKEFMDPLRSERRRFVSPMYLVQSSEKFLSGYCPCADYCNQSIAAQFPVSCDYSWWRICSHDEDWACHSDRIWHAWALLSYISWRKCRRKILLPNSCYWLGCYLCSLYDVQT